MNMVKVIRSRYLNEGEPVEIDVAISKQIDEYCRFYGKNKKIGKLYLWKLEQMLINRNIYRRIKRNG